MSSLQSLQNRLKREQEPKKIFKDQYKQLSRNDLIYWPLTFFLLFYCFKILLILHTKEFTRPGPARILTDKLLLPEEVQHGCWLPEISDPKPEGYKLNRHLLSTAYSSSAAVIRHSAHVHTTTFSQIKPCFLRLSGAVEQQCRCCS